jgi:predicted GNAT family N-acyltransferase
MKEILVRDDTRNIVICRVSVDAILDLRHRLLRAGLPRETAQFPGDEISSTWHLAVFNSPAKTALPVSCASFMLNSYKEQPAWQLRGMATDNTHQSKGFGGELLRCGEALIFADSNVRLFWCNARVPAIPFYQKHGWKVDSEEFDIPTAGPHRKMVKGRDTGKSKL